MEFRKSSFSGPEGNNCVEIARTATVVAIQDSKADGFFLVTPEAFDTFRTALSVVPR
nr:DUF397 domain-containing protein [Kibdelosporangium sp. MJ126-NF4]CEL15145.1 hypothetical protein [Kibdelosporangium sp. MJ126-NF4]CTQ93259.1 hypothetical protein [Kibdelosporangium sp. MJ126-NF4]